MSADSAVDLYGCGAFTGNTLSYEPLAYMLWYQHNRILVV